MIDFIILFLLVIAFFVGFRRGLILQVVHIAGLFAAFIVAYLYFDDVAPFLKLWVPFPTPSEDSAASLLFETFDLQAAYYKVISFAVLFFGTKIALHIIGSMLDFLADFPILRTINGWLGGTLAMLEVYVFLFILLYVGALTPLESIQSMMNQSILAKGIVEHTPLVSQFVKELWLDYAM